MFTARVATTTEPVNLGGAVDAARHYWLFKTEPGEYGIEQLAAEPDGARWDGIRNYQARNLLRDQVSVGDGVFIYHSSCKPAGIAGVATVTKAAYADPSQFDPQSRYRDPRATAEQPRWFCVDVGFVARLPRLLTIGDIRSVPELRDMVLLRQGRLSIQPVTAAEWRALLRLAGLPPAL
jgi:predicted RNA-binding protein with PUA-like domain